MEDFAKYILEEENLEQKMSITYILSTKQMIFFDKSIVLKAEIAKLFIEYMKLDVDENLVLTAMLLCNCKKIENAQKMGKLETYAKDGAEYLQTLGFSKRFCKICEEVNRYSNSSPRERESDILEVVDQFTGLILNRVEREAFTIDEALVILKERNLKYTNNRFLSLFEEFVNMAEKITIKESIEVPIIKKLIHLHNKEANVKTLISVLTYEYAEKIANALKKAEENDENEVFGNRPKKISIEKTEEIEPQEKDLTEYIKKNQAFFSEEIAQRILTHKSKYKVEE